MAILILRNIIVELRYKLRIFGVTFDRPSYLMCDNQLVVHNTSLPKSNVVQKHNAVNFHVVHQVSAASILRVGKEDSYTNLDDIVTKILGWKQHHNLLSIFYIQVNYEKVIYKSLGLWASSILVKLGD